MRALRWLAALLVRGRDAQFIREDLEELYARDRANGSSVVQANWRYARMLAGSVASLVNETRTNMRNALLLDLRQASRALARDRGFTVVSLTTLGSSLALCVIVTVLVNVYLVRGLPYPDSHRLYDVRYGTPAMPFPSGLQELEWSALDDVLDVQIAWDLDDFTLRGNGPAEIVEGTWATRGYVDGFGVRPAIGRGFEPADFEPGRPMVALISDRLWRSRFNANPAVVGATFEAFSSDRPNHAEMFTIVGVLPANHWHLNPFTEIIAPLRAPGHPYVVRVRDGVSPEVAADRMTTFVRAGVATPADDWRVTLTSTHGRYVERIRPLLLSVASATGLVLLIACANVGVLLTLRATRRRREMAVRQALGATAGQVTRVCAAEPVLIGSVATVVGLALAWAAIAAIAPLLSHYLGRPAPGGTTALSLDPATLLLTVAAGIVTIAIASIVPIWVTRRTPVSVAMSSGQKGFTDGPLQRNARTLMITIEVAACLTLLVGAGLTIQSAIGMLRVDMGLNGDDVMVGRFNLRQRAYPDAAAWSGFYERVLSRSGEIARAQSIGLTNAWPLQQSMSRDVGAADAGTFPLRSGIVGVSPGYFDTVRIPLHEGRVFTAADRIGSAPVVLVSRTLATRLWGGASAIGRQLRIAPAPNAPPDARALDRTVVGVVGDVRHAHTDDDLADAYVPILQSPIPGAFVYVRAVDLAAAERELKALLNSIDGEIAFGASRPLTEILDLQRAGARLLATLLVVFATFAATLALVGIYAVAAYSVKQREREVAVRLAIGADRQRITRMFLREGAIVLCAGLALGIVGALALGRVLRTQLFGVQPADPIVLAGMTLAFAVCGLVAITWPARSAASLDSASALRE